MSEERELVVLCGLPGSGKSTYANKLINEGFFPISSDEYVEMYAKVYGMTYDEAFQWCSGDIPEYINNAVSYVCRLNIDVVWDQTNLSPKKRKGILNRFPKHYVRTCVFFEVPEDVRQERLGNRKGKTIPAHVDSNMRKSYGRPTHYEGFDSIIDGAAMEVHA